MKRRAQPWLGTLVDISIADDGACGAVPMADVAAPFAAAFSAAFAEIAIVHKLMSYHDPASDVSRINRVAVGETIDIDAHTARVLALALMLADESASIFNIGCASRLVQWHYLPKPAGALPPYQQGDSGLALHFDGKVHTVHKKRSVLIDVGGIAKGYAVDQAILALQQAGIASACVNAGGDVRVLGDTPFSIAIRDPSSVTGIGAKVHLANAALATSATYFSARSSGNGQDKQGAGGDRQKISALIDGRSGQSVITTASATVQAQTCMVADALTKIVMATGDAHHPLLARYGASALLL
ncbi:MAG: thiamine biosynthesis lipoprotein [Janthinobacterium sp.]|jgi:thiamine biosynthesis lipoprotein